MTRAATTAVAAAPSRSAPMRSTALLQRTCACDHKVESSGPCSECEKHLQRKAIGSGGSDRAPPIVHEVLGSAGQPLDSGTRAFMEPRFAHSFGAVRIHTDGAAAASARAVHAAAYTVGHNIVFDSGRYAPDTAHGRRLLAHELTHVVQQSRTIASNSALSIDPPHSASEREAERIGMALASDTAPTAGRAPAPRVLSNAVISRADPGAPDAATLAMHLGRTPRTGLQFWPTDLVDTQVGPVTVRGGLMNGQANRLNVIIAENMTLRTLGVELLPFWVTATPFTPPGAAAPRPLDIITADELARGLLVYNQYYLQVPAMTRWRAGLRFPLPIEIDEATHVGTLHPLQIRALAGAFDPAWEPLLDRRAPATAAPAAAILQADVAAFLTSEPTALGRGIALGARALTNAVAELPFIREAFRQLGAGAFDVALELTDNVVIREIQLLASQRDGAAIIGEIRAALAAGPAAPSATQQASLTRATTMLNSVAGVAAQAPPGAARNRAEKTVGIDTVKLDGSTRNPSADVALANGILAQCNVRLAHNANATATPADTAAWIGADRVAATGHCGAASAEERRLMQRATAQFGLASRIRAFYVLDVGSHARAESYPPYCATGAAAVIRGMAKITNTGTGRTLGHEVGHILLNSGAHPAGATNIMSPTNQAPQGETISDAQCTTIYNNA